MNNQEFEVIDVKLPEEIWVKDDENTCSNSETQQVLDNVLCDD